MSAEGSTPWCDQVWLCCPPCTGWLVYAVQPSHLPQPAADVATSLTATARAAGNVRDEVLMLPRCSPRPKHSPRFTDSRLLC